MQRYNIPVTRQAPGLAAGAPPAGRTGKGILKVARELGVGSGTVQRVKKEMQGPFDGVAA